MGLLRIYWYDAPPATGTITHPVDGKQQNLGQSDLHRWSTSLLDSLEMQPDFALRRGEVSVAPAWTVGTKQLKAMASAIAAKRPDAKLDAAAFKPRIEQKGVDLRIGLDIARLALRELVSTIVVVTGDSDMIPAFKFARREGLRVYLDTLDYSSAKRDLKAHVDLLIQTAPLPVSTEPKSPAAAEGVNVEDDGDDVD